MDKRDEIKDVPIWPVDFFIENDEAWFVHGKLNALFRYSLIDDQLFYEGSVSGVEAVKADLFSNLVKKGDKIYLVPLFADRIGVYDIKSHQESSIAFPYDNKEKPGYAAGIVSIDNKIYCIPFKGGNGIACIDTDKGICYVEDDFNGEIPEYFKANTCGLVLGDGIIIFTITGKNEFLKIDVISKKISVYNVPYDTVPIAHSVAMANGLLYFLGYNSDKVYVMDSNSMEFIFSFNIHKKNALIQGYRERYLLIDSFDGDGAEIYDTVTGVFRDFNYSRDKKKNSESYDYNVGIIRENDRGKFYYYNRINNEIIEIESGKTWVPKLNQLEFEKISEGFKRLPKPQMITEGIVYGLNEFLFL